MKLQDVIELINSVYENRMQDGASQDEACLGAIRVAAHTYDIFPREIRALADRYRNIIQRVLGIESEGNDEVVADALTNLAPEMRRILGEDAE